MHVDAQGTDIPSQGLPGLDIIYSEAFGGDALLLSAAGAGPRALRKVLPVQAHAQQVEAAGTCVTQCQWTVFWVMRLQAMSRDLSTN